MLNATLLIAAATTAAAKAQTFPNPLVTHRGKDRGIMDSTSAPRRWRRRVV